MSQIRFQQIWFADEKKNRSATKFLVLTDRGSLDVAPNSLQFWGRKLSIQITSVKDVSLTRQQINWVTYLIFNVLLIIFFAFLASAFSKVYSFSFLLLLLFGADAFGLVVGYNTKWVKVEYSDDKKQLAKAFFADGSAFGWKGIFGGAEKLYQAMKQLINRDESAIS